MYAGVRHIVLAIKTVTTKYETGEIVTSNEHTVGENHTITAFNNKNRLCYSTSTSSFFRRFIRGWWLWVSGIVTPRFGTWTLTPPWTRAWWCRWWASCPTTCSPWGSSCRPLCWHPRFVLHLSLYAYVKSWWIISWCFLTASVDTQSKVFDSCFCSFREPLQTNSTSTTTCFVTKMRCSVTLTLSPLKVR